MYFEQKEVIRKGGSELRLLNSINFNDVYNIRYIDIIGIIYINNIYK